MRGREQHESCPASVVCCGGPFNLASRRNERPHRTVTVPWVTSPVRWVSSRSEAMNQVMDCATKGVRQDRGHWEFVPALPEWRRIVEFGLLGTLEVTDGGRAVVISAPKQRALLVALLLRANQVVSVDRLLDELWGEQPPPQALAALQAYVSRLRRALEPHRPPRAPATLLVSRAPGYLLVVDRDRYDVTRFEDSVRNGTALLAAGQAAEAHHTLSAALNLWRGPAIAEFAGEPFAEADAARLEELRTAAVEARIEAAMALGRHGETVAELERLVVEYPLRERLWAALMLASYRAGRQAEALSAFRSCRTILIEQFGLEPGPALRALEQQILEQAPDLDWRPSAPEPNLPPVVAPPPSAAPVRTQARPLIGRESQLELLDASLRQALDGSPTLALLTGDAGIGKSRLAEELAARARLARALVLCGRCFDGADAPPFWPWTQALRTALADHRPVVESALAASGSTAEHLAPVLPELAATTGLSGVGADQGQARFHLYGAVTAVVNALAAESGLVLIVEDLHWADPASLQLLQFAAAHAHSARLLVLATYRDAEIADGHPLVATSAALARELAVERLTLDGMAMHEVERFVDALTGTAAGPRVARAVHSRTEGNPFFVSELVRLLDSEGALHDEGATARSPVPLGVRDVIRRRLARLPEQTNALLTVAAVIGPDFDLSLLGVVAGLDADTVIDAIDVALVSGVVTQVADQLGRYRFQHSLVRETVYAALTAPRRARLHARVGQALEAMRGRDDQSVVLELAAHYSSAADVTGADEALPWVIEAAEVAIGRLAYEQAEELLRRALVLLTATRAGADRDRRELWLQVRLGVILSITKGQAWPEVGVVFTRARQLCGAATPTFEELSAGFGLFLSSLMRVDLPAARSHARQLADLAPIREDPRFLLAGHLATGLTRFAAGELAAADQHFERVIMLADSLDDPALAEIFHAHPRVSARCYRSYVLALGGQADAAADLARQAQECARRSQHTFSEAVAETMDAWLAYVCREPVRTWESAAAAAERANELGFLPLVHGSAIFQGWAEILLGRHEQGIARVYRGLAGFEDMGMSFMRHVNLAVVADAEQQVGLLTEALTTATRAIDEVERTGECFYAAELYRLRGELLFSLDPTRAAEAEACLIRAVELSLHQQAHVLHDRAAASLRVLRKLRHS